MSRHVDFLVSTKRRLRTYVKKKIRLWSRRLATRSR
jgi:hypothetical protein